jgi:cell division protein FtsL
MGRNIPRKQASAIKLPQDDKITLGWIATNVPVRWWGIAAAAMVALVLAAFSLGTVTAVAVGSYQLREVQAEVSELLAQRETLKAEVVRLQVEKNVESMTPQQVREALKQWTRDDPTPGAREQQDAPANSASPVANDSK